MNATVVNKELPSELRLTRGVFYQLEKTDNFRA